MRAYYVACFLLLAVAGSGVSAPAEVRLPMSPVAPVPVPAPTEVSRLTGEELYVVDSDIPLLALASPVGIVTVTEESGPFKIRSRFVDSDGKIVTRTYKGKHIYLVEAAKTGRVELLLVPVGASKAADVIRRTLDVEAGEGPRPPPDPKPKPDPAPDPKPAPVVAQWVVVVEESSARTPDVAKILNDVAMWKRIEAKGIKYRIYDADSPDAKAKKYDFVAAQVGLPCVILLDATGNVVGKAKLPKTAAELEAMVK